MAITGRFDADFQPFLDAVQAANKALDGIEAQAKDLNTTMDRFSTSHWFTSQIVEGELYVEAIKAALSAVEALVAALPDLALNGAVVEDVTASFERLAAQAGTTADVLLGALRTGTHGTIDDFALMQRANENMSAGLLLTDAQFGQLATDAYALAKSTGTDAKAALDALSDAMVRGQARGASYLIGKIDLKAAEEKYTQALKDSGQELSAEGKLQVDRDAILAQATTRAEALGVQTDNLKDKVDQARVAWTNLYNDLGKSIAQSKTIATGMDGVRDALISAFGTDRQDAIHNITHEVEDLAIGLVEMGKVAVMVGERWALSLAEAKYQLEMAGIAMTVASNPTQIVNSFGLMTAATKEYAVSVEDIHNKTVTLTKGMDDTAAAMRQAQKDQDAAAASARDLGKGYEVVGPSLEQLGAAVGTVSDNLPPATQYSKQFLDAWKDLNRTGSDWAATVTAMDGALVGEIQYYLQAGASLKTLAEAYPGVTAAQITAIDELQKHSQKAALDVTKLWNDYAELVGSGAETAYGKAQAAIDKWYDDDIAKHQASKTDTAAYYLAIAALDDAKYAHLKQNALEADAESRAAAEKKARDDEAAYQFALANQDQFSQEHIEKLRLDAAASKLAADGWGLGWETAGKKAKAAVDGVDDSMKKVITDTKAAADARDTFSFAGGSAVSDKFAGWTSAQLQSAGYIDAYNQVTPLGESQGLGFSGGGGRLGMAARAAGGPVTAGQPYMVGEQGPELFVPSQSGSISPNGAGVTVHNTFNIVDTESNIAQRVAAHITRSVMRSTRLS